jgi:hypothetical protein
MDLMNNTWQVSGWKPFLVSMSGNSEERVVNLLPLH